MTTKIKAIDERIDQLRKQRAAVLARERERERKRDTRRKILIGAELLALVKDGDEPGVALYRRIRDRIGDGRNAAVFEGWEPTPHGGAS